MYQLTNKTKILLVNFSNIKEKSQNNQSDHLSEKKSSLYFSVLMEYLTANWVAICMGQQIEVNT